MVIQKDAATLLRPMLAILSAQWSTKQTLVDM